MLKNKFNQQRDDINDFFSLAGFFDSIEAYKNEFLTDSVTKARILVNSTQQKCMRCHAVLMLYNIVESTTVECILAIYDAIKDDHLSYEDLNDSLKSQWLKNKISNGETIDTRIRKAKEIIANIGSIISFQNISWRFNGNVDLKTIIKIFKDFELQLGAIPNSRSVEATLRAVKEARNKLAHGDISYSNYGSSILFSDIERLKKDTLDFLSFLMREVDTYILDKRYKNCKPHKVMG